MRWLQPLAICLGVALASSAHADGDEHRLALGASAVIASTAADGGDVAAPMGSFAVQYGWGWTNSVELGGSLRVTGGPRATLPGVVIDGQPGDLHTSVVVVAATLDVRLVGGIELARWLYRTHPYVALGVGLVGRGLLAQDLLVPEGEPGAGELVLSPATDVTLRPLARLGIGVERRTSAGFSVAVDAGLLYGGDTFSSASLGVELAWYWY